MKKQMRDLKQIGTQMSRAPDGQVSLTDPDARSIATSGRGTGMVGYNVQTAVDTKHHMIVAYEVTNVGRDREQLSPMSYQTRDAIDEEDLTVLADRGYYKSEQILDCEQAGIKTLAPKSQTSSNKAAGLFDKADFRYIRSKDEYRCPAGQIGLMAARRARMPFFRPVHIDNRRPPEYPWPGQSSQPLIVHVFVRPRTRGDARPRRPHNAE